MLASLMTSQLPTTLLNPSIGTTTTMVPTIVGMSNETPTVMTTAFIR